MTNTTLTQNIKKLPFGFSTKDIMLMLTKSEVDPQDFLKKDIPQVAAWINDTTKSFIQEGRLRDLLETMAIEITTFQDINIAIDAAVKAGAKGISQHKTLQEQSTHYSNSRILHQKSLDDMHKNDVAEFVKQTRNIAAAPNRVAYMETKSFYDPIQRIKQNREKLKTEVEQLYKQIKTSQREALIEYRYVYNPDDLKQTHPSTFEGVKKAPEITIPEKAKVPTTGPAGGQTPTPTS